MSLSKKVHFDDEVLGVLRALDWLPLDEGGVSAAIEAQLDRPLYEKVKKAINALGGKWNRKLATHIFEIDPREQVEGLLDNGHLTVVRDGWFPTPAALVDEMLTWGGVTEIGPYLEPSAGEGAIAKEIYKRGVDGRLIHCVEKNEHRAEILRADPAKFWVQCGDFLDYNPDHSGIYHGFQQVFMNPPWEVGQDTEHVMLAYSMLAPGGVLVGIMSKGAFYRSYSKERVFVDWFNDHNGEKYDLEPDVFKESGAGSRGVMIKLSNPTGYQGRPLGPESAQMRLF